VAKLSRRNLLWWGSAAALAASATVVSRRLARAAPPEGPLSPEARSLVDRAWKGLDPARTLDGHVHVVGLGTGGTGCELGARLQSPWHPLEYLKFKAYLEASAVSDLEAADAQYLDGLRRRAREQTPHGRLLVFGFDRSYDEQGNPEPDFTEFYTPNDYVLKLARETPELFVPCASIHPYRRDAVAELERVAEAGAVAVKWLPNAMGIDPSNPRCDSFYSALERLRLPLITHAGEEKAVHAEERQRLGNPLHLRRALERGASVVVAHCASLGQNPDLDAPANGAWVENFDLFLRLMREPQWEGRLFGEISALTLVNRLGRPLETVLGDKALQRRLINGSDYPLPAINVMLQTRALVRREFITEDERTLLNEIDAFNPLLFDFVVKRTVRRGAAALADDIFMVRPELFPRLSAQA
jgi:mannonate dehydratase